MPRGGSTSLHRISARRGWRRARADPGLPKAGTGAGACAAGRFATSDLFSGRGNELAGFRFNLRPIALFAIGCVIFTACAIAAAAHWLLGLPWAVAFVLGAIIAPPDVVAPLAIARRLGLPRRLVVVLEGEGLANDATALILYRFAVAAVSQNSLVFPSHRRLRAHHRRGNRLRNRNWLASLRLRQWARDPRVEITLSLMTPYVASGFRLNWEGLWGSRDRCGRAVCQLEWSSPHPGGDAPSGDLFLGSRDLFLEGLIFLVMGLQARSLIDRMDEFSPAELAFGILLTVGIAVVARFMWVFPAISRPRWLSPALAKRDPSPPWQWAFLLAFAQH